jgi:hypothetical protein
MYIYYIYYVYLHIRKNDMKTLKRLTTKEHEKFQSLRDLIFQGHSFAVMAPLAEKTPAQALYESLLERVLAFKRLGMSPVEQETPAPRPQTKITGDVKTVIYF